VCVVPLLAFRSVYPCAFNPAEFSKPICLFGVARRPGVKSGACTSFLGTEAARDSERRGSSSAGDSVSKPLTRRWPIVVRNRFVKVYASTRNLRRLRRAKRSPREPPSFIRARVTRVRAGDVIKGLAAAPRWRSLGDKVEDEAVLLFFFFSESSKRLQVFRNAR